VAVSPWSSPFFQHVNAHETVFAGVPDYIHEAIVRAYVKTAAFKPIDDAILDMIVNLWTEPDGKAAFYRQIAQANSADAKSSAADQQRYGLEITNFLIE